LSEHPDQLLFLFASRNERKCENGRKWTQKPKKQIGYNGEFLERLAFLVTFLAMKKVTDHFDVEKYLK